MDGEGKQSREASTSKEPLRLELEEDENWTTVRMVRSGGTPSPSPGLQRDATTSYATNRETVFHKNARTIEETHLIRSTGSTSDSFSEEHWTSEIKSYITAQPPKFVQVIKAFRVLATDTLTLVVEVQSEPPAIFEWFCNDKPVQQDRKRFKARHGINITTLTVEGPEQGVYKCTARNPAGLSTTYGYIIVSSPPPYKSWVEMKRAVVVEEKLEEVDTQRIGVKINRAPKFINQVPNLTLKPGSEAVIDVEVEASPPAKFTWFVNGFEMRDSSGQVEVYTPAENRCVARFPIPQTGEYKVVAENAAGRDHSIGYVDIRKEVSVQQMQRPPLPSEHTGRRTVTNGQQMREILGHTDTGRASSVTKTVDVYEESSYYQRSTSLPRPPRIERHVEVASKTELLRQRAETELLRQRAEESDLHHHLSMRDIHRKGQEEVSETRPLYRTRSESTRFLPQAPVFVNPLPSEIRLTSREKLVLAVDVRALPQAEIKWNVNGFEMKRSKTVTILDEQNRSTLVVQPPVKEGRYSVTAVNDYGMSVLATKVHRVEEESYEVVEENLVTREERSISRHKSSPPEIVENAITITSAHDEWEVVDDQKSSKSSAESFETVKMMEVPKDTVAVEADREQDKTPQIPQVSSYETSTFSQRVTEESSGAIAETSYYETPERPVATAVEMTQDYRRLPLVQRQAESLPKRPFMIERPEPEIHVKAGEKLVLKSKVDSYPESTFRWYHNNFEVRKSNLVEIESLGVNESQATFHKPSDGVYKVVATNSLGSCSSSTRVVTEITEEMVEETSVSIVRAPKQEVPQYKLVRRPHVELRKDLPMPPRIIERCIPLIRIPQNLPLILTVQAESIPEATFTWLLNNFEVRQSSSVTIERVAPNTSRATFASPSEGRYEAVASNYLGKDSCSTKVAVEYEATVTQPERPVVSIPVPTLPVFIQPLPPQTVVPPTDQEFRLVVTVSAQQPVTYRWFADGSLLSNSVEHQMMNETEKSTLIVRRPVRQPVDYAVEVSNAAGTIWSETRVSLLPVAEKRTEIEEFMATESADEIEQRGPRFTTTLSPVEVFEGSQFTAKVTVENNGIPCEFLWSINGKDIRQFPGTRSQSSHFESILFINPVTSKTSGNLTVVARNSFGSAISSAAVTISKKEASYEFIPESAAIPAERPPTIITPLHSAVFRRGQPMILRCKVDAFPSAEIMWTKDEINLEEWVINRDVTCRVLPDGTCELSNPECFAEDAGIYQCRATNRHGTAETAALISVEAPPQPPPVPIRHTDLATVMEAPKFTETMKTLFEKEKTVIMCKVQSREPVFISWLKDRDQLRQSDKHTMHSLTNGTQTLTIRDINIKDEGLYTCRAQSRYGVTETSCELRIPAEESKKRITVEEHIDEEIGVPETDEFVKKAYTDSTVKITTTEVTDRKESYSRTTELCKSEEEYKLLVKVAETVARRLVANVVVHEAIREAVSRMREEVHSSEEEDSISYDTAIEHQPCPPRFDTNIECYTVDAGDTVKLATDIGGYPMPRVEWYFGEQKLEQSEQVELYYLNGRATLIIKQVAKVNEGKYYCHAENEFGKAVLACNLRVMESPAERAESILDFSKPPKEILSETETEVFSNIYVNHTEETFEHHVAILQPELLKLGYDCKASTSKVYDDSVIITREELLQRAAAVAAKEVAQFETSVPSAIPERQIILNVSVDRPPSQFAHDVRILQADDAQVSMFSKEKFLLRSEEVMQTADIQLVELQKKAHAVESTENVGTMGVFERASEKFASEVRRFFSEKVGLSKNDLHAVSHVDIGRAESAELLTSVLAIKDEHKAHATANVEVRRPAAVFDHTITVVEPELVHLVAHLTAPTTSTNQIIVCDLDVDRPSSSAGAATTRIERPLRKAVVEQRFVILEGLTQTFSDAITWSLRKIQKGGILSGEAITNSNVEVRRPAEAAEHVTTIIDKAKLVPEVLAVGAASSKLKMTSVFVSFSKKGDVAHQSLVIEYASYVEEEASLNVALLTAPGYHSKQEERWIREGKVEKGLLAAQEGPSVVAVFVDVDASFPDQNVELIASINIPVASSINVLSATKSSSSLVDKSFSLTESSSIGGLLQMPKFVKRLENVSATIGQPYQFKCIVSGVPMPHVRWFVDGDEIHKSAEYETVYEDGVCILRITEVVAEDEGEYICEAANEAGTTSTKCFLHTTTKSKAAEEAQLRKSQESLSEETSSYIMFHAPAALEEIVLDTVITSEGVLYPRKMDSNEVFSIRDQIRDAELLVISDREFSFSGDVSDVNISRTNAAAPQALAATARFVHEEANCSIVLKATENVQGYEITQSYASLEGVAYCCTEVDVMLASCPAKDTDKTTYVNLRRRQSVVKEAMSLKIAEVCEEIFLTGVTQAEHCSLVVPIKLLSEHLEVPKMKASGTDHQFSDIRFMRNLYSFVDLLFHKEFVFESAVAILPLGKALLRTEASFSVSKANLIDKASQDSFPESKRIATGEACEPRIPLLPQKLTYKGQEIGVSVHEVEKLPVAASLSGDEPNAQIIQKCVEAIFNFGANVGIGVSESKTLDGEATATVTYPTAVRQELSVDAVSNTVSETIGSNKSEILQPAYSASKPENADESAPYNPLFTEMAVITEEDIEMFENDSSLSMTVSESHEETRSVTYAFRKESLYGQAIENRGEDFLGEFDLLRPTAGGNDEISSSTSQEFSYLRSSTDTKDTQFLQQIKQIEKIAKQVEAELGQVTVSHRDMKPQPAIASDSALEIERAIFDISEKIVQQEPLTEAQAEASEELLKATLEDMIMHIPTSSAEDKAEVYKRPIALLKQKLSDFENSLMIDEEIEIVTTAAEEGARREASAEAQDSSRLQLPEGERKKVIVKRLSQEFARMTPITMNIQEQLSTLEKMLDEDEVERNTVEEVEDFGQTAAGVEDGKDIAETSKLLPHQPTHQKRKDVHKILVQINQEINTIRRYCHRNISQRGVDAVVHVLNKVRTHVGTIVNVISISKKRNRRRSPEKQHTSRSGYFSGTEASINFNLFKECRADEAVTVIVMFRSASEKSTDLVQRSEQADVSLRQYDYQQREELSTAVDKEENFFHLGGFFKSHSADTAVSLEGDSEPPALQPLPVPPPRPRRASLDKNGDSVPVRPPRLKRRSQSREQEEQRLIEILASQSSHSRDPRRPSDDFVREVDMIELAEIRQLQESINASLAEFDSEQPMACPSNATSETMTSATAASFISSGEGEETAEEFFIRKRGDCGDSFVILPMYFLAKSQLNLFDEASSVQLVCEESDYGTDTDTGSRKFFATLKPGRWRDSQGSHISESSEPYLFRELRAIATRSEYNDTPPVTVEDWGDLPRRTVKDSPFAAEEQFSQDFPSLVGTENVENIEVDVLLEKRSQSFEQEQEVKELVHADFEAELSSASNPQYGFAAWDDPETSTLHDVESVVDKDEHFDDFEDVKIQLYAIPRIEHAVSILSTIMERSETSNKASSVNTLSTATSVTTTTTTTTDSNVPARTSLGQQHSYSSQASGIVLANPYATEFELEEIDSAPQYREMEIVISDENFVGNASEALERQISTTLSWRRRSQKYKVIAELLPDIRAAIQATLDEGETFEVFVEQPSESQNYVVRIVEDVSDSITLSVVEVLDSSVDVFLSLSQSTEAKQETVCFVRSDKVIANAESAETESVTSVNDLAGDGERTGVNISIVARSTYDIVYASLEEIPWGEVSMHICTHEMITSLSSCGDSENRTNSIIQNVTVSESNDHERKSLHSRESVRSSQRSLALSDLSEQLDSSQNVNVPTYALKEGSTATITCELNNFLNPESIIEWYKGKTVVHIAPGKIDRISHDLLEVLVISHVTPVDSDVYSIRVNDEIYPVACLVVEEIVGEEKLEEEVKFLSPPQTLFVMEGQPSVISCQVSVPNQRIIWCKDRKLLSENERIRIESDAHGFHRVLIQESELEDQGTYFAYHGNHFTTITLVVEERIDEKEVTVTASSTESDEDEHREYIVPIGSTATIACELEPSDEARELSWRKDGVSIVFDDDAKLEHVVNGLKHYLVIHDTQPSDSACYSVRINNIEFKVAHMSVSDYATSIAGKRSKRISNTSLQRA